METIQIILQLAQANSSHIETLNREMGSVMADLAMIKWFMGINIVAWVGLIVSIIGKKLFKNNKRS